MKQFLFLWTLVTILLFSLLGSRLLDITPVVSIGPMQVAAFDSGISLFQNMRGYYYTFSPFNDYTIDSADIRSSFISYDYVKNKQYSSDLDTSIGKKIIDTVTNYVTVSYPHVAFSSPEVHVTYTTNKEDNALTVTKTVETQKHLKSIGNTLTFQSTDFLYDSNHKLLSYPLYSTLPLFEKVYGIPLAETVRTDKINLTTKKLALVNPSLSAVFIIKARPTQSIVIDNIHHLIEVKENVSTQTHTYTSSLQVEIFETPKDAEEELVRL